MEIRVQTHEDVKVISVQGHLESSCVSSFRDKFMQETADDRFVVLDCAGLEYLDSSGLAALVSIFKSITARQGKIVISGLPEGIRKVIEFTKLDKVFNLADSLDQAFEEVRS